MEISPVANDLLEAIDKYLEASSKVGYRFTLEEQMKIQRMILILDKHIVSLMEYEMKREK